jgi:hypothetical protein
LQVPNEVKANRKKNKDLQLTLRDKFFKQRGLSTVSRIGVGTFSQ